MSDLGHLLLWLSFAITTWTLGVAIAAGVAKDRERRGRLMASAQAGTWLGSLVIFLCACLISYAFYIDDFSLRYVAGHSSRDLPRFYAITALWSGMEGSLTWWSCILGGYAALVVLANRSSNRQLMPWVIVTLMGIQFFFIAVQIGLADPFEATPFPIPVDGRGLNPQLQNPGMVIHPPMLYLGYVGCAVPFAFAMAALITGKLDDAWIRSTRRWLLTAWAFLSVGILLGGAWAYVELGWGGYWAWDPVENASLLPWLAATPYLHSVIIQEKRGMLKVWNMGLVFLTFWLSVLGTFLTRSGFVQSVHVFAQSDMGWYFLGFLIAVLVFFLVFFIPRLSMLKGENTFDSVLSREAAFLFQNWLFLLMVFVVILGTLGEPISRAVQGVATTFRSPYFNALSVPLGLGILFMMGVGPVVAWRKASTAKLKRLFFAPTIFGFVVAGLVVALGYGMGFLDLTRVPHIYAVVTFGLCAFVVWTVLEEFWKGAQARRRTMDEGFGQALTKLVQRNRRRYGGYIVHLATVLVFAGIGGSAFNSEGQGRIALGEALAIEDYVLHYVAPEDASAANSAGFRARIEVFKAGEYLGAFGPEKRFYHREEQYTSEVAIHSGPLEDLYMVVNSVSQDNGIIMKVYVNPLVSWIWAGGFLLIFGTIICIWPSPEEVQVWVTDYDKEDASLAAAARG